MNIFTKSFGVALLTALLAESAVAQFGQTPGSTGAQTQTYSGSTTTQGPVYQNIQPVRRPAKRNAGNIPASTLLPLVDMLTGSGSSKSGEKTYTSDTLPDWATVSPGTGIGEFRMVDENSEWGKYNSSSSKWDQKWNKQDFSIGVSNENLDNHECTSKDADAYTCAVCNAVFEACDQGYEGMKAVVGVTLTRALTKGYPNTICEVVYEGHNKPVAQFSWTNNKKSHNLAPYKDKCLFTAKKAAVDALNSKPLSATNFWANYVSPDWSRGGMCSQTRQALRGDNPRAYHLFCQGQSDVNTKQSVDDWLKSERSLTRGPLNPNLPNGSGDATTGT